MAASPAGAQAAADEGMQAAPTAVAPSTPVPSDAEMVQTGMAAVLAMQEGPNKGEWPYEGVYRVGGLIPYGYRIGGTSICGEMLLRVPGYGKDSTRQAAIARATEFVLGGTSEPLMGLDKYEGGYDVRGWGLCYGARFLLALKAAKVIPAGMEDKVEQALIWYLRSLQEIEIPKVGGWNYARDPGKETPSAASPFMTAPCLQTLYQARAQGYQVDEGVVDRALAALLRCRTDAGNYAYSAQGQTKEPESSLPGAVGRMVSAESALFLAGKSDGARVKRAVEAFIEYWPELEKRRAKNGTHKAPFGVAPYYFYFAHYHAAAAIELLPEADRPALRARIKELLLRTRSSEGTWDDRVFPRTANYGTSMAVMSILMPTAPPAARWESASSAAAPASVK